MRTLVATCGTDVKTLWSSVRLLDYECFVVATTSTDMSIYDPLRDFVYKTVPVPDRIPQRWNVLPVGGKDFDGMYTSFDAGLGNLIRNSQDQVVLDISGGSKLLSGIGMLLAFKNGLEAWYHEHDAFTRIPLLKSIGFRQEFTSDEWRLLQLLGSDVISESSLLSSIRNLTMTVRSLKRRGFIATWVGDGNVLIRRTEKGHIVVGYLV